MAKNAKIRPITFGEGPIIRATFGDLWLLEYRRSLVDLLYIAEAEIEPPTPKMIGYIGAQVLEEYDEATNNCKHHGYISKVAVRVLHRRRGLATRLITVVEDNMKQDWKIDYITVDVPKTFSEGAKLLFEHNGYTLAANEVEEDAYHFVKQFKAGETKGFCSHQDSKRNRKTLKRRRQKEAKRRLRHDGSSSQEIKENNDVDSGSGKPKKKTKSSSSQEKTKGNAIAT